MSHKVGGGEGGVTRTQNTAYILQFIEFMVHNTAACVESEERGRDNGRVHF